MIPRAEFRFDPETHTYWLGTLQLPSVTQILDSVGLISSWSKDETAALRGAYVHLACQFLMEKRLDWSSLNPIIMPYVISLDRWIEETGFVAKSCEVSWYHRFLLYGGTTDTLGVFPRLGEYILDLKTGVHEDWHELQSAGYSIIFGGHYRRACLHLQKDGSRAKFVPHRKRRDRENFLSCLNVYRLKEA